MINKKSVSEMLLGGINQGKGLGRVAQPSGPASSLLFPVNFTSCSSSRLSSERGSEREGEREGEGEKEGERERECSCFPFLEGHKLVFVLSWRQVAS